MRFFFAALLTLASAFGQSAGSLITAEWTRPFPPFRMIGNLHWVGTYDLSSYLITTAQGHILINSGLADSVPQITAGIEKLGFKLSDVKILTTQYSYDSYKRVTQIRRGTSGQQYLKNTIQVRVNYVWSGGGTVSLYLGSTLPGKLSYFPGRR